MVLDSARLAALRQIWEIWQHRRCVLVGATALELRLGLRWRKTHDLDIAVEVELDEMLEGMRALTGWSRRGNQRWRGSDGVLVDMIPASPESVAAGELVWPETEARMNLIGFGHALERSEKIPLDSSFSFPVAPVAVLALLKMTSYLDRPVERGKDLQDLFYILEDYVEADHPRRYQEDVLEADLDYDEVSGFVLGREMRDFTRERDRQLITRFINRVRDVDDPYQTQERMAATGPPSSRGKLSELLERVQAIELGIAS